MLEVGGRSVAVETLRRAGTRGMKLRADSVAGVIRLSLSPRVPPGEAAQFLNAHYDWIAAQVARWPVPLAFVPGAGIPFDGGTLRLDWSPTHPRVAARDGDRLRLGGPADTVAMRTARWLKAQALADLAPATHAVAAQVARPVSAVAVRDPRGRWGSCATGGRISYSWRLILAPDWVRANVVAHEVAHLVHPNHSPAFYALLAELDANTAASRRWLRANGAALHWVGRAL